MSQLQDSGGGAGTGSRLDRTVRQKTNMKDYPSEIDPAREMRNIPSKIDECCTSLPEGFESADEPAGMVFFGLR
jgi:hypothetical protein